MSATFHAEPQRMTAHYRFYFVDFPEYADFVRETITGWNVCLDKRCSVLDSISTPCPLGSLCETIQIREKRLQGTADKPGYLYEFEHVFSPNVRHDKIPGRRSFTNMAREAARTRMLALLKLDLLCHDQKTPHQLELAAQLRALPPDCVCQ
jgi:hypothetical protein